MLTGEVIRMATSLVLLLTLFAWGRCDKPRSISSYTESAGGALTSGFSSSGYGQAGSTGQGQGLGNYGQDLGGYGQDVGGYGQGFGSYGEDLGGYGQDVGGYGQDHGSYGYGQSGYGYDEGGYGDSGMGIGQGQGQGQGLGCRAAEGAYFQEQGMDEWCRDNCSQGYCPPSHCTCY